jgi:hypothetical protein
VPKQKGHIRQRIKCKKESQDAGPQTLASILRQTGGKKLTQYGHVSKLPAADFTAERE